MEEHGEHAREGIARRAGTLIVCGIPTFVGAGILWDLVGGAWTAVIAWILIMGILVGGLVME